MRTRPRAVFCIASIAFAVSTPVLASPALADDATVHIVVPEYSRPPPPHAPPPPVAVEPVEPGPPDRFDAPLPPPVYREVSPLRLALGGAGVTTGRGVGPGLGVAMDIGRGSVGFRLGAVWFRHESGDSSPGSRDPSPLAGALSQYTGELTLDVNRRGPLHPIVGIGFGMAYLARGAQSGTMGIGTARVGLDYALALDDVDVRVGADLMGAMPGPADREVEDVRAYAILGGHLAIGF